VLGVVTIGIRIAMISFMRRGNMAGPAASSAGNTVTMRRLKRRRSSF